MFWSIVGAGIVFFLLWSLAAGRKITCPKCGSRIPYAGVICLHCREDKSEAKFQADWDRATTRAILAGLATVVSTICGLLSRDPVSGVDRGVIVTGIVAVILFAWQIRAVSRLRIEAKLSCFRAMPPKIRQRVTRTPARPRAAVPAPTRTTPEDLDAAIAAELAERRRQQAAVQPPPIQRLR
jgi:hypothetical protein